MQILLALIVGAVIGAAAHLVLPHRDTRGTALAPIVGAVVAGAVWTILTWSGVGIDSVWPWLSAIIAPAIVVFPAVLLISRIRLGKDAAERERLKIS